MDKSIPLASSFKRSVAGVDYFESRH